MPRDLPVGNGSLLVAFDSSYRLADFYFPHVGMENHAASRFRMAVWCDGALHSCDDDAEWQLSLDYLRDTLVTDVTLHSEALGLKLRCYDAVDPDRNVYVRRIVVRNLSREERDIKVYLHHDFALYGNPIGDTVLYDPPSGGLIQYKAHRFVLVNCEGGVVEYACGRSPVAGGDGTWFGASQGALSMDPIAQGAVEATIGIPMHLEAGGSTTTMYWICAGRSEFEVRDLDEGVRAEGAANVLARTGSYWYTWVNKSGRDLSDLPDEIADFYRRSLLVIATQCDRGGAVLAANDSDITWGHNDHYSYLWTRDASFVCDALDRAGYPEITARFLRFANTLIRDEGYFLNKYNADGSPAPLWQPWIRDGKPQLPIQEDETALVIWLAARHYERTRDLELLREIYPKLVVSAADFLLRFRDAETGLPRPSYDLWEESLGAFTFTSTTVWAGLSAAASLAALFNDHIRHATYLAAANEIRDAMKKHLWIEGEGRFARGLVATERGLELDESVDASTFAVSYFGLFPAGSAMAEGTVRAIRERLWVQTDIGGVARFKGDAYHRISEDVERVPGNPWTLCTLWLAEHDLAAAEDGDRLQVALDHVRWARAHATGSSILPEQLDPFEGTPLSVAPLTWSHAQAVSVVLGYLEALQRFR